MLQGQDLIAHHLIYDLLGFEKYFGMLEKVVVREGESAKKSASAENVFSANTDVAEVVSWPAKLSAYASNGMRPTHLLPRRW